MSVAFYTVRSRCGSVPSLSKEEKDAVEENLRNFLESTKSVLPAGCNPNDKMMGFYFAEKPKMIGYILYDWLKTGAAEAKLMPNWTNDDRCTPYVCVSLPECLSNFHAFACLMDSNYIKRADLRRAGAVLKESMLTACMQAWRMYRFTRKFDNGAIARTCCSAPLWEKGALLGFLRVRLYGPRDENFVSEKMWELRHVVQRSQLSPGQLLFFVRKVDLCDYDILLNCYRFYLAGGEVIVIEYESSLLCKLLSNVITIGGIALMRMTEETPLQEILKSASLSSKVYPGLLTRNKEASVTASALSWTLGYLLGDGLIGKNEFIEAMADVLQCNICEGLESVCHSAEHDRLLLHQATIIYSEMSGHRSSHTDLIWWDKKGKIIKTFDGKSTHPKTHLFMRGLSMRQ